MFDVAIFASFIMLLCCSISLFFVGRKSTDIINLILIFVYLFLLSQFLMLCFIVFNFLV